MTDKMMLASMFAAAVAVIALVASLCMTIPGKRSRSKRAPATRVEIPTVGGGQDAYETRYIYAHRSGLLQTSAAGFGYSRLPFFLADRLFGQYLTGAPRR